jgi:gliding motility-associated-like protein
MKKYFYLIYTVSIAVLFYIGSWQSSFGQGTTCATSTPFCTASGVSYPAGTNNPAPPSGPNYTCRPGFDGTVATRPNPAWFYLQVNNTGAIDLALNNTPSRDIDFAIWGPFAVGTTPAQACTTIFSGTLAPTDCSYSATINPEIVNVSGTPGQIFVMMVTNYSNQPTNLTITQTGGVGTTDCIIITNDCVVDLGADINLCQTDTRPILDARRPTHDADTRYQWFVNGVSQGAASTTSTLQVQAHVPSLLPNVYKVIVSSVSLGANGCRTKEDDVNVTIKPTPLIDRVVFPNDSTLCSASGAFARVVASQVGMSYQILRNGTPFGGLVAGTGNTIQLPLTGFPAGVSTMKIQARYTVAPTCTVTLTEQAELTVLGSITTDLGADSTICENRSILMDGTNTSIPANATFQWRRSTDGGVTYADIVGATSVTYTASETLVIPQTPFEVFYKLEIRIPASTCVYSDEKKVTFEPLPLINRIIEVDSICNTGTGRIRIVNPQAGARYSYRLRANNAGVAGANIGAAQFSATGTPITFITPTITTTTKYFIEVRNTLANIPCVLLLTVEPEVIVHPLPTAEFSGGANLCVGEDVELTVTMTGTQPFSITFRRDGQPQITTINNIASNTYTFFTDTAGVYRVTKIQDFFCENLVNNITTRVNVNPVPDFTLGNDITLCDSEAPLVLEAETPVDFDNPTYKWFRDGLEIIGETASTYTTTETSVGLAATTYEYTLEVTNNEATNTTNCVFSDAILVTFTPNPVAQINFAATNVTGTTLQFCDSEGMQTLDAFMPDHTSFTDITYQWTDLGTGLVVGNTATLPVNNFNATTNYELLVTDGGTVPLCGNLATVTVKFIQNPVATISHDGTVVPAGGSLDFCFDDGVQTLDGADPSHAGITTVTYEWNDVTNGIPLGNNPQIDISNPTNVSQSIDYELIVRDESNTVFCERTATMTVNFVANPIADIQFNGSSAADNLSFCDSEGARTLEGALPSHAAFGSLTYIWTQVGVGVISSDNIGTLVTPASNFSASVTYTLEVINNDNPNLCSRTDEITIEFFPSPDTNISFDGNAVTELGFCTSEGAKTVSAPASPFYTYQWYRGTVANPLLTTLGTNRTQSVNNFATQGGDTNTAIYTLIVTDTRATCPAQSSLEVSFYAEPEIAAATLVVSASPATHCVTGTSTISVRNTEANVEYQLTKNGVPVAGAIRIPTVDLSTVTFPVTETTTLTTGTSRFEYGIRATRIGDFGRRCTQTLADTATLLIYPEPTATVAGTATVCANEPTNVTFTLTGNFPATLTYQVTDTFNVSRVQTQIVGTVGSASPQTFVISTNTNKYKPLSIRDRYCSGTVTATEAIVTTVHPPVIRFVEYDTAFCINEPATFKVRGGLNHQYFINGLPVSTQNPYIIQANSLPAGTYKIYAKGFATANGCPANSDTITFRVHPLPVVDLGVDRTKCTEDTTYLVVRNTGSFIYDWKRIKTDNTVISVGNGNDSLGVSLAGRYFVIVTNLATGCSDSSNVIKIDNYAPLLRVNLGADVTVCSPSRVPHRLVASDIAHPQGTLYKWYKENNATVIGTDSIYNATAEGVYRVTVTDPRGCDARDTIRVNFTADPDFRIIGHDNYACGTQDTLRIEATNLRNMLINWQGSGTINLSDSNRRAIVNVSGIYSVTVRDTSTIANCSVTKSVEVFVRPRISLVLPNTSTGDTTTLCQGDSLTLNAFDPIHDDDYKYRWTWLEGNQVISSTSKATITYNTTQSFTSQRFEIKITDPDGGCFVTDTVNVRFRRKPIARITASDSVICIGESVILQGGESFGNRFEWIRLPETTSFATTTNVTVTPDSVGEYTYILKSYFNSSTPCGAINDTIRIRVNRKAVANIEEEQIRLCENEQLEINGFLPDNPAFTRYIWIHEENNLVLSQDSILNISFNEIQPISYEPFHIVLTVYDSLTGCDSTDRVLVKFNRASKITIDSTYRTEICLGDSVKLRARGATSYSWRKLGDTTNTVLDSTSRITVKLDSVGFHTFIVTGGYLNECQNTGDTAIIYVNPLPTIRSHSVDTVSICADDSITLYPSGGKSYVWLNDPTAFDTITVSPKVPTNYIVMGTDSNGCQSIDTVHVYVTPTFELPALLQVCENEMVMIGDSLNFADSSANVRATYFWTPTGETTPFINVGVSGTYTVEVSIDDCSFTRSTEVQVKPKPILELVSDTTLCFELGAEDRFQRGETHILRSKLLNKDSATTYLYVWTDSTGQYLGNKDSLEIEAGGNYRLRVIARYATSCETSDSTFVTELCQPRIFIPEAFTPNGDNLNDNFEIFGKHIKNFEMQIFNRWSEVIYEVRAEDISDLEPQDFWDGTYKGKNVPTGAYIWIIRYTDPFSGSTKQVQKTGSFMIVR